MERNENKVCHENHSKADHSYNILAPWQMTIQRHIYHLYSSTIADVGCVAEQLVVEQADQSPPLPHQGPTLLHQGPTLPPSKLLLPSLNLIQPKTHKHIYLILGLPGAPCLLDSPLI